jgi:hypothetical protein
MLDIIVSSKTRIKLLIKFFLVKGSRGYLRGLEKELNETSNAVRVELNRFEKAGMLVSCYEGKRKIYQANPDHPLYEDLTHIVHKTVGIDQIIERIACKVGDLEEAYLLGNFARGVDSDVVELALVGTHLDPDSISAMVKHVEETISRRIAYLVLTRDQMDCFFRNRPHLLIWGDGKP